MSGYYNTAGEGILLELGLGMLLTESSLVQEGVE